jgi:hypothetical protein
MNIFRAPVVIMAGGGTMVTWERGTRRNTYRTQPDYGFHSSFAWVLGWFVAEICVWILYGIARAAAAAL